LGRIAWRFDANRADGAALTHFGSYRRNPLTNVVCGCSPAAQDRLDFGNACGVETCERFEQVLEKRPDIVSICSPSENHFEQTLACLEREIPMVWLEKPPTLELRELDTLINHPACRTSKTKVLVNYGRRYSKLYDQLRTVYREQPLGRPLAIQVLYSRGLELNGSHFLDLTFSMLGDRPPLELFVSESERQKSNPTFVLRFADDFVVSVCGHDAPYHINDVALVCDGGRVSVLSGGLETRVEQKIENELHAGFFRLKQTESRLLDFTGPDDWFSSALSDLIGAHEADRQPRSNLATARHAQAVIEEVRRG
jgi:predicted dehydrogenase